MGAFIYNSSAPSVATVDSSGLVTIVSAGTTTITATQAAAGGYTSAFVEASVTINPIGHTKLIIRNGGSNWQQLIINNDTNFFEYKE